MHAGVSLSKTNLIFMNGENEIGNEKTDWRIKKILEIPNFHMAEQNGNVSSDDDNNHDMSDDEGD
jgi:hypothetical protein